MDCGSWTSVQCHITSLSAQRCAIRSVNRQYYRWCDGPGITCPNTEWNFTLYVKRLAWHFTQTCTIVCQDGFTPQMVKIELGRQNMNKQSCIKPQCMLKIVRPYNCSGHVINLTSSNGNTFILNRLVPFGHKRPYHLTQDCSRYTDCKIWHEIHLKPPTSLLLKTSHHVWSKIWNCNRRFTIVPFTFG